VARCLLRAFGIEVFGFVRGMLDVVTDVEIDAGNYQAMRERRDASDVYCPDEAASDAIRAHIREAKVNKDTVGGLCEVHVFGCPIGLGSCMHWDDKLDSRLAAGVMGIQAFKSVEIGMGKDVAFHTGSQVHDAIEFDPARREEPCLGFTRPRNHAGGLEGGMTDGMPIVVRGAMKPISTLLQGMPSVNLTTKKSERSDYERSDVCALSAASVVMENVVGFEVAKVFLEKFGGDTMLEIEAAYRSYLELARNI
jgi:chorismate synthase